MSTSGIRTFKSRLTELGSVWPKHAMARGLNKEQQDVVAAYRLGKLDEKLPVSPFKRSGVGQVGASGIGAASRDPERLEVNGKPAAVMIDTVSRRGSLRGSFQLVSSSSQILS